MGEQVIKKIWYNHEDACKVGAGPPLKSAAENKICFCRKQNCLNVIYFYVPKKIYCEARH